MLACFLNQLVIVPWNPPSWPDLVYTNGGLLGTPLLGYKKKTVVLAHLSNAIPEFQIN